MKNKSFSVHSEKCPSRNIVESISDKWSILVMTILFKKMYRFGELKREVGGISQKMLTQTLLTQTLQKLEKYGLIKREAFPILPLKVEYSLTILGKELSSILHTLTNWTEANMQQKMQKMKLLNKVKIVTTSM